MGSPKPCRTLEQNIRTWSIAYQRKSQEKCIRAIVLARKNTPGILEMFLDVSAVFCKKQKSVQQIAHKKMFNTINQSSGKCKSKPPRDAIHIY